MSLSAEFSVEGSSVVQGHTVAYGATVDLVALSTEFRTIAWAIVGGSKSGTTTPTITLAGTPTGATASFPQVADPGDGLGRTWIVRCTQTDSQGNQDVRYRVVGTVNSQSRLPIAVGEETYRDAVYGWTEVINSGLNATAGAGTAAIDWKESVRFATTAALDASTRAGNVRTANANGAFPVVDGVTAATNNRLLDKDHATAADRGVWTATSLGSAGTPWVLTRATDADTDAEVTSGAGMLVEEGTANGGKLFILTTANPITLNTTALAFSALSGSSYAPGAAGNVLVSDGTVFAAGALNLAAAAAVTGLLPLANLASLAGLSVLGRSANSSGVTAAITGTDGQALRVSGTVLGFGTIATAGIGDAQVTYAKLANSVGLSVSGRSANTSGVRADLVGTDGQVLRVSGTALSFGQIDLAVSASVTGTLPQARGGTGFAGAGGTANRVFLTSDGTTATWSQINLASAQVSGVLALANITGGSSVGQVLRNAAGNVPQWGALDLADADAVTGLLPDANLANLTGLSVSGRSANSSGVRAAITGTDGQALRVSGTVLGFGTLATAGIGDAQVTLGKFANGTALSVIGRAANTGGAYADVVATTVGQVLGYQGSALAWGTTIGDTFTMVEVATLATNREIVSLCLGADLTTTQMPAGTGDKVTYVANATAVPTTGTPDGGTILYSGANLGLAAKTVGQAETTVAVQGDTTVVTRKLAEVKVCDTIVTAAVTQVSILEIDTTAINGAAADNCALLVRIKGVGIQTGAGGYGYAFERVAVFLRRSGTLTLLAGSSGNGDADGLFGDTVEVPTVLTMDSSANLIRLRVAPGSTTSTTWFAVAEVTGVAL